MKISQDRYKKLSQILNEDELNQFEVMSMQKVSIPTAYFTVDKGDIGEIDIAESEAHIYENYMGFTIPLTFPTLQEARTFARALSLE